MVFFKKMTRLVKFAQYAYMDVSALQVPSSAYSGEIKYAYNFQILKKHAESGTDFAIRDSSKYFESMFR